jgi:hypothetical protein
MCGEYFLLPKESPMKLMPKYSALAALGFGVGALAFAQGVAAQGPGPGPGNMRFGPSNTSGWALMTRQERIEHQSQIRSMKTYEECKAYVEQHHTQMVERAKEKGRAAPAQARSDACAWLKSKS